MRGKQSYNACGPTSPMPVLKARSVPMPHKKPTKPSQLD